MYALAGNEKTSQAGRDSYLDTDALFDITMGSNGHCSPAYLCTGEVGYDGPTGNGTPNETGGF